MAATSKRWGAGPPSVDDFDELVFDFEPFIADILPALNATGHHQSAAARKAAIDKASVSAPEGMSRQKLDEKRGAGVPTGRPPPSMPPAAGTARSSAATGSAASA